MKLSVFLNHVMEGARQREISLESALEAAKKCGIDYLDADARELKEIGADTAKIFEGSGLKVAAVNGFFDCGHKDERDGIRRLVETASAFGAKRVMAIPGFAGEGEDRSALRDKMAEALAFALENAKKCGITLVLEDFDSDKSLYGGINELKWFMDNVSGLSCAFDTGNFIYHADDVLKAYDVFRGNIAHVHLKDRGTDTRCGASPLNCVDGSVFYPVPVGYGIIPIAAVLKRLSEDKYSGIYTIEHFGAANQLEAMRLSAEWLRANEAN